MTLPDKAWLESQPKTINENGCWISTKSPRTNGYVPVMINRISYTLSRLSMCIINNVDYFNYNIDARHNTGCDRRCFNPEHLKPGTRLDNVRDSIRDNTHSQSSKLNCPKCGDPYVTYYKSYGGRKSPKYRICRTCANQNLRNYRAKQKALGIKRRS